MINKTAVLDLDDTLGNLKDPLYKSLNKFTGKDIHWKEWNTFNTIGLYGMNDDDFFNCIINDNLLEEMLPYEKTEAFLNNLKENDYKIVIITSRAYHPNAYNLTTDWFAKYNLPYDAIHITGHGMEKADYIKSYDNIIMAVDDRIENCISFEKSGLVRNTVVYDMPWNQDCEFYRISCLSELHKFT